MRLAEEVEICDFLASMIFVPSSTKLLAALLDVRKLKINIKAAPAYPTLGSLKLQVQVGYSEKPAGFVEGFRWEPSTKVKFKVGVSNQMHLASSSIVQHHILGRHGKATL